MASDELNSTLDMPGVSNNSLAPPFSTDNPDPSIGDRTETLGGNGNGGMLPLLTIEGEGMADHGAPVPDVLLSLAKDDRYISEVVFILSQVIVPFASIFFLPRRSDVSRNDHTSSNGTDGIYSGEEILEDDGRRFIDRIRPELNLLASVLVHSATFVFYARNFGGKGAELMNENARRSLGMESLNLAYRYPDRNSRSDSTTASSKLRNNYHSNSSQNVWKSLFPSQTYRWHWLILLQTVVPYIIQRAGRGGWSTDLGGLTTVLLQRYGLHPQRTGIAGQRTIGSDAENDQTAREEVVGDSSGNIDALRNDDRLRGLARRRLFEEHRRRMIHSSGGLGENDVNTDSLSSQENAAMIDTETRFRRGVQRESANSTVHEISNDQSTTASPFHGTFFGRGLNQLTRISWEVIRVSDILNLPCAQHSSC